MNNINNNFILVSYKDETIKRTQAFPTLADAEKALSELSKDYTSGKIFIEHKEKSYVIK